MNEPQISIVVSKTTDDFRLAKIIVWKLYLNRALSAWADRCWQFAVGLYLIKLYSNSLLLAGIYGIVSSLSLIIFSPMIGSWVKNAPRLFEARLALCCQNLSVCVSAGFAAIYFSSGDLGLPLWFTKYCCPFGFIMSSVFATVAASSYTLILEHDWMLVLIRNQEQLTHVNASLRRIDMKASILAPAFVGALAEHSPRASAIILCIWVGLSAIIELKLFDSVYMSGPEEIRAPKKIVIEPDEVGANSLKKGWFDIQMLATYREHFLLPGLSFAMLYMTVLSLCPITIGYLSSQGLPETSIGVASSLSGVFGGIGTFMFPPLVKRLGLNGSGLFGFAAEALVLYMCLAILAPGTSWLQVTNVGYGYNAANALFLLGVVLSRTGLWLADLSINQLIQGSVNPPLISGIETSLNITFGLFKHLIVLILPDVATFWILTLVSVLSVTFATGVFAVHCVVAKKKSNL